MRMTRPVWLTIGVVCVATGAAGVVLPLLPATPFLLLAAYAFARSSPRLHGWLLDHAHFGPLIQDWREQGSIARRTKVVSLAVMAATLLLSFALQVPLWIIAIQAAALAGSAAFIVTRPERGRGTGQRRPT
jgi:uncharacterized membrane protein YbaN (DUF454 family)